MHVTNRHLRLAPVVARLAEHLGMDCIKINNPAGHTRAVFAAEWMLMTRNPKFLQHEVIQPVAIRFNDQPGNDSPLWTDQTNNLFQTIKIY